MTITAKIFELAKWTIGGALLTGLVACGSGGGSAYLNPTVANADVTAPLTAANIAALQPAAGATPATFTFNSGFSGTDASGNPVNLSGPTTVAITGTATAPTFSVTNGGGTATGTVTFGSCIFTVKTSTTPTITVGSVMTVDPCSLTVDTNGITTGTATDATAVLNFGGTLSASGTTLSGVTITKSGTVSINGTSIGTVTVTTVTGAGA